MKVFAKKTEEAKELNSNAGTKNTFDSMEESAKEDKNDLSLGIKIKHLFIEWILASTSHGLPSVFRTDQVHLKVIWLVCFLASTIGCAYIVVNYIITYLEYSVIVSTTKTTETPIDFPSVTICNLNPFKKSRAYSFLNFTLSSHNLLYTLNLTSLPTSTAMAMLYNVSDILKLEAAGHPRYNSSERKSFGFYLDDMLISCKYGDTECTSNEFAFFRSFDYGNCYTFNSMVNENGTSMSIRKISNSGPGHGLEIELYAGDPEEEYFTLNRGFYVVIHNSSSTPIMDNEGVVVGLGQHTNIGIDRSLYNRLPGQYSGCILDPTSTSSSNSALYKAILTTLKEKYYRKNYCYKLCYQENLILACSCYDSEYANPFPSSNGQRINSCHTPDELICMLKSKINFESSDLNTLCYDDCPQECNSCTYTISASTSSYPSDFYLKWLLLQPSLISKLNSKSNTPLSSQIRNSVAKVNIFYNDISYTLYSESPMITWDSLLGNVGGQLGLFIGISFLSLVEVIEVIIEVFRTMHIHRRSNKLKQDIN